jgi:hypothetical protein
VAEGRYAFRVDVKDAAGNRRVTSTPVVVDRTASYLRWSRAFYPQDADTLAQSSLLTWTLARDATTSLKVYDAGGHQVTTAWTGRRQAAGHRQWTWYGKRSDGSYVPQGTYQARLTVTSVLGTVTITRTVSVAAFSIAPSATRLRAGQTLRLSFRSNEPLGSTPVVTFKQAGLAAASVRATRLADGSYRASFRVRAGGAGAATVRVSARDNEGRSNATAVAVRVVP